MRPSDDTRERTVKRLRRGYVAGRLDTDTFSRRIDVALRAEHGAELSGLTADIPRLRAEPRRWFRRRPAGLLDGAAGGRLMLGRSPDCQLVFADDTVSRRHAEFRRGPDGFRVSDVGSLNGTYVNRDRIDDVVLNGGDEVQIGKFRLVYYLGRS